MKELLFSITRKDLELHYFSGTGKGGQFRNRHKNCVRLRHPESGAMVTGQSHRERPANIKEAMNNLVKHPKFRIWLSQKNIEIQEKKTLEEKVDESMDEKNLKVEVREDGKWMVEL